MSRVVFFDFDSTVVSKESLDEVIACALSSNPNKERLMLEIESITNRGMNGEIGLNESVQLRLAVVPLFKTQVQQVGAMLTQHITQGMPELFAWLQTHDVPTYIVSGGFSDAILPTATILNVPETQVLTNRFVYDTAGKVTGADPNTIIWKNEGKAAVVRHVLSQYESPVSALIGDGSNDLAAYTHGAVQHFCGFGAHAVRPTVQAAAPAFVYTAVDAQTWLAKVLQL
jgi:HAD superfamily phosphoserine phosphatase-like hydrolase